MPAIRAAENEGSGFFQGKIIPFSSAYSKIGYLEQYSITLHAL
jgi:hypothetical protein